jgi:hypothetical protein
MEPNQPIGPLAPSDPTERNHPQGSARSLLFASGARVSVPSAAGPCEAGTISMLRLPLRTPARIFPALLCPRPSEGGAMSILLPSDAPGRCSSRTPSAVRVESKSGREHGTRTGAGTREFSGPGYPGRWQLASHRGARWPTVMDPSLVSRTPARSQERNTASERAPQPRTASLSAVSLP